MDIGQKNKDVADIDVGRKAISCTHENDTISRQQAIDICDNVIDLFRGQFGAGVLVAIKESIEELPPVEPELPEWAKKIEEHRKSAQSYIQNPLAWALYQTWKEYDR